MIKPKRRSIGVVTGDAVALLVAKPEIFAQSFVVSGIGLDVILISF